MWRKINDKQSIGYKNEANILCSLDLIHDILYYREEKIKRVN